MGIHRGPASFGMTILWTGETHRVCWPNLLLILLERRLMITARASSTFHGLNHICFGPDALNYVVLPVIPPKDST